MNQHNKFNQTNPNKLQLHRYKSMTVHVIIQRISECELVSSYSCAYNNIKIQCTSFQIDKCVIFWMLKDIAVYNTKYSTNASIHFTIRAWMLPHTVQTRCLPAPPRRLRHCCIPSPPHPHKRYRDPHSRCLPLDLVQGRLASSWGCIVEARVEDHRKQCAGVHAAHPPTWCSSGCSSHPSPWQSRKRRWWRCRNGLRDLGENRDNFKRMRDV